MKPLLIGGNLTGKNFYQYQAALRELQSHGEDFCIIVVTPDGIVECRTESDLAAAYGIKNCNSCPHISITEEEQHKQSVKIPHICTKYNKHVLHGNQHKGQCVVIVPCGECLEEANRF